MAEQQVSLILRSVELELSRTKVNATEIKIVSCSHVSLASQTQPTPARIAFSIRVGVGWVWLARLVPMCSLEGTVV